MCILCTVGYSGVTHDAAGLPAGGTPPFGTRAAISIAVDSDLNDADQNIDALISGSQWNVSSSSVITFSFPDSVADFSYPPGSGVNFANQHSSTQQIAAREVLADVASFTNLVFVELGDDAGENNAEGTLRFVDVTGINTAFGYYPNSAESGGDMAFKDGAYETPTSGSYEGLTFGHEVGHALGLKHGHDTTGAGALTADHDSMEYSIMTYRSFAGQDLNAIPFYVNSSGHYAQSAMMYDIAALQRMYGANHATASGDTVYTFSATTGQMTVSEDGASWQTAQSSYVNGSGTQKFTNVAFRTVWDGDGVDTYDLSNFATDLLIDLTPGGYVDLDVGGNALRARLNFGYNGTAQEYARGHVFNALQHNDDARSLIENATGGSGNDVLIGNAANNILTGGAGIDRMEGGGGDDTIHFGAGDVRGGIGKLGGSGIDTLILEEGAVFNTGNISAHSVERVIANSANNDIQGQDNSVDYVFSGMGGADRLAGAGGNDILNGGADNDRLIGGAGADTLNGGDDDDVLLGGEGADILTGGAGIDRMEGGGGDDTIHFGAGDVRGGTGKLGGSGIDTLILEEGAVFNTGNLSVHSIERAIGNSSNNNFQGQNSSVDYILTGMGGNDRLAGAGGNDILNGGDDDDILLGAGGADTLIGGAGVDRMEGGSGDDTIHFGAGDVRGGIGKLGGSGIDTLILEEGAVFNTGNISVHGIERVIANSANNDIQGQDNSVDYVFSGMGGADRLAGAGGNDILNGGADNDRLIGGAGVDQFVFEAGFGNDTIVDFDVAFDRLVFENALFGGATVTDASFIASYVAEDGAGNALVTIGDNTVFLKGVADKADLTGQIDFFDFGA